MAVEKSLIIEDPDEEEFFEPEWVELAEDEDEEGLGLYDLLDDAPPAMPEHGDNLAEFLDETVMRSLASELITQFDDDLSTRTEWERRAAEGLSLLGITPEDKNDPWPGASGVFHPVLAETAVAFQANAVMELCPASGPAKFKVIGEETQEKLRLGKRVSTELNYQTMERMTEWRPDTEQLLFRLPLAGLALKKVYFDPLRKRPVSKMIPAEDFVIQNGASDLETCPRYCHREKAFVSNVIQWMHAGVYRVLELSSSVGPIATPVSEAEDDIVGVEPSAEDDRVELLEFHCDYAFEDFGDTHPVPYVITIERNSHQVLAIYRNYREGDPLFRKKVPFVVYNYLPGLGFYTFGAVHLVGGGAEAATALLRQLIDAGTLANVPSGFKANTFRVKGDDTPIRPGEFRDVDLGGAKINDSLLPLPYKEPSATALNLLVNLVEEVRRVASVADMKIGDQSAQTPVGTTLALLERSLRVMSAVHARLHQSMKIELRLIAEVIRENMPPAYDYDRELDFDRAEDFGGPVDIVPVSDPNSSTQAQRVIVYQAAVNIAAQAPPGTYDMPRLHRGMLEVLGVSNADQIVPLPEDLQPVDPVSENMALLMMKPVKAFIEQDHEAHLRVHMAAMQDPKMAEMVGQSPHGQAIQAAAYAHVQEHMAYMYRRDIERKLGVPLPPPNEPLPDDTAALIATLAAAAAEQVLGDHAAEAKAAMMAQQAADPELQIKAETLRLKDKEITLKDEDSKRDAEIERDKLRVKVIELKQKDEHHDQDLSSQEAREGLKAAVQLDKNKRTAASKKAAPAKKKPQNKQ